MKRHQQRFGRKLRSADNQIFIDVFDNGIVQVVSEYSHPSETDGAEHSGRMINTPLHPTLYAGMFRHDPAMSESELSFSTATPVSEWSESERSTTTIEEMTLEELGDRPVFSVPIIEIPSEQTDCSGRQSEEGVAGKTQSISVVGKVRGHAIGAVIEPSSTVLMQLSKSDSCGHQRVVDCIREVNDLLDNQNSLVILKYPSTEQPQSSRRVQVDHRVTTRKMMELTENVLERVQGSTRESLLVRLQLTLEEMLNQPEDTIVVHTYSRQSVSKAKVDSEAFVGFFGRDDNAALFVQTSDGQDQQGGSLSGSDDDEQMSVDRLRSFLRNSMVKQEELMEQTLSTEPNITVSRTGDNIIAVLSFPNTSSGVLKAKSENFPVEHDEMVKMVKDLFRELVEQPSEKLVVQVHSDDERSSKVERMKLQLDESMKSGEVDTGVSGISVRQSEDKVIGVLSYTGGSVVIQTSSKNWINPKLSGKPEDLLCSIRLLIEHFITNNELSDKDLESIAAIIAQVFHSDSTELSEDFLNKHLLVKMRIVMQQLMMPEENAEPLVIINQIRETLEDISRHKASTIRTREYNSGELLKIYFEELLCDEDSEFDDDSILFVLREALLDVLIKYETSLSSALEELLELLKTIPAAKISLFLSTPVTSCPGVTFITDNQQQPSQPSLELDLPSLEVVQKVHDLLSVEEPTEGRVVSYLSTFQALFVTIIQVVGSWSLKVKSFLNREPSETVQPEPSLTKKPSVSFQLIQDSNEDTPSDISRQLEEERHNLNETIDDLRQFLMNSLDTPDSKQIQQRKGSVVQFPESHSGVQNRMLKLFSKLLEESGKMQLSEKGSDEIHLRLESASGDLERKGDDKYVMLTGSIRDREQNLGLFFEARLVDLRRTSKIESEVECVTEVRRLSDEVDELDEDLVPGILESCLAQIGSEWDGREERPVVSSVEGTELQENWSRYFELIQNYIQESVEPMRETMQQILAKLKNAGTDKIRAIRSSIVQTSSSIVDNYFVELHESHEDVCESNVEEVVEYDIKCVQCSASLSNERSTTSMKYTQEQLNHLQDIGRDLDEIKKQLQVLISIQQKSGHASTVPSAVASKLSLSESTRFEKLLEPTSILPCAPTIEELDDHEGFAWMMEPEVLHGLLPGAQYTHDPPIRPPSVSTSECLAADVTVTQSDSTNVLETPRTSEAVLRELHRSILRRSSGGLRRIPEDQRLAELLGRLLDVGDDKQDSVEHFQTPRQSEALMGQQLQTNGSVQKYQDQRHSEVDGGKINKTSETDVSEMQRRLYLDSDVSENCDQFLSAVVCGDQDVTVSSETPRSSDAIVQQQHRRSTGKIRYIDEQQLPELCERGLVSGESETVVEAPRQRSSSRLIHIPQIERFSQAQGRCLSFGEQELLSESVAVVSETFLPTIALLEQLHEEVQQLNKRIEVLENSRESKTIEDQLHQNQREKSLLEVSSDVTTETIRSSDVGETQEGVQRRTTVDYETERTPSEEFTPIHETIRTSEASVEKLSEVVQRRSVLFTEKDQEQESTEVLQSSELSVAPVEHARTSIISSDQVPKDQPIADLRSRTSNFNELSEEFIENSKIERQSEIIQRKTSAGSLMLPEEKRVSELKGRTISFGEDDLESSEEKQPSINSSTTTLRASSEEVTEPRQSRTHSRTQDQLDDIPVRDGEPSRLCNLALSYQCRWANDAQQRFVCPAEIYSCHEVGPNQLMIHWDVSPEYLQQIAGYEVHVDGETRVICYSRNRRTALVEGVNTEKEHRVAIYANPDRSLEKKVQWAPGVFFYHL